MILINRLVIIIASLPLFWKFRSFLGAIRFISERNSYKISKAVHSSKSKFGVLGLIVWTGIKKLFWVLLSLAILIQSEHYLRSVFLFLPEISDQDERTDIEQLKLYTQLLTTIFSIYFATIGIILSTGYTKLRRDIIQMLISEQVGSLYSNILVFSSVFCLVTTIISIFGYHTGLFVYVACSVLTILSFLTLFPLGQRLFSFFDLNALARTEILPRIIRHIDGATSGKSSVTLANHHSKLARKALEQLYYIDDRITSEKEGLKDRIPALTDDYMYILLSYLGKKHTINQSSYWFPRRHSYTEWFLAGDMKTSLALNMSNQHGLIEEKIDQHWLENEISKRLLNHIELAFKLGDFELALTLMGRFSKRGTAYADHFHFETGMHELKQLKAIIEQAFDSPNVAEGKTLKLKVQISDTWSALVSNLSLETLRRMQSFESELEEFFNQNIWTLQSLARLPAYMQVELKFIVDRIEFEKSIEGERLSQPKYVQQLAVQRLLFHYEKVLHFICRTHEVLIPDFIESLIRLKLPEAATQVALASLHDFWKLPRWFEGEISELLRRYKNFEHYKENPYKLPEIDIENLIEKINKARDVAVSNLGREKMVKHVYTLEHNDEMPDHFGQLYFELAEASISALQHNDSDKLEKVLPMFMKLAFLSVDSKFLSPEFDVNERYRLNLVISVIKDIASVLGFAILYSEYFGNEGLCKKALSVFDNYINMIDDKQFYLRKMIILAGSRRIDFTALPREMIRGQWGMNFEQIARNDGYGERIRFDQGAQHQSKIVREFMWSHAEASHLFFASQILPKIEWKDIDVDYSISSLAERLNNQGKDRCETP